MLSERYLRHRYRVGFEQGFKEGFKRSFRESFIRTRDEMLAWYKRLDAAAAEGKPFNEPPPCGWERFNQIRNENSAKAQELPNAVKTAVNATRTNQLAELESWYIRKGLAEDMGIPFNEPHPFNGATKRDGNGTV